MANLVDGEQKRLTTALPSVGKAREVAKIVCEALQDKGGAGSRIKTLRRSSWTTSQHL